MKYNPMRPVMYHYQENLKQKKDALIFKIMMRNVFYGPSSMVQHRNHQFRVLKYQAYERELSMYGIQYPIDIKDISIT